MSTNAPKKQNYNPVATEEGQNVPADAKPKIKTTTRQLSKVESPSEMGTIMNTFTGAHCGSRPLTAILGILNLIPVAMIIIGVLKYNKCQDKPALPLWLLVFGIVFLIRLPVKLFSKDVEGKEGFVPKLIMGIRIVLKLFIFVWFVLGCILAISAIKTPNLICSSLVVWFSFTLTYLILRFKPNENKSPTNEGGN
ncbi:hypothetical protein WR25_17206 isoform A [Diploscapter pachys]|uniref:Uncharacterized protein n=1 Tax=Diploscapter pachys TaxID=2018661 RepID=A0A2A2JVS3_9BILA|nr:hypothetical protein WR25_17206 isoform A [Diploscapter pachys]